MLALLKDCGEFNRVPKPEPTEQETTAAVNAVTNMSIQTETLKVLQDLHKQLQNLTQEVKNGGQKKDKKDFKKTPDNPPFQRSNTEKYCWTHGACNHDSSECTRRAPGHKADATKANKKGGSKAFCE